jgi:hypothetical protein
VAAPVWKSRARLSHVLLAVGFGAALRTTELPALQAHVRDAAQALSRQLCGEAEAA